MKFRMALFLFFIASFSLIFFTIEQNIESIYDSQFSKGEAIVYAQSTKSYIRRRKGYIPQRSFILAVQEIKRILKKGSILSEFNENFTLNRVPLIQLVEVVNHMQEEAILTIFTYTDTQDSSQKNLALSQKIADRLKEYFLERTTLPLVVAIGYGEAFSLKKSLIEINLKRIKP